MQQSFDDDSIPVVRPRMPAPLPEQESSPTPRSGLSDRFAKFLTYAINPLILPTLIVYLIAAHVGARRGSLQWIAMSSVFFYFVLPLFSLILLRIVGQIHTIEVRIRENRQLPLIIGFGLAIIAIPVIGAGTGDVQATVGYVTGAFAFNVMILLLITMRFKISMHVAGTAAFSSFLWWFATQVTPPPMASINLGTTFVFFTMALTPLMMWARVRARAHTLLEVLSGAAFGIVVPLSEMYLLTSTGLLP